MSNRENVVAFMQTIMSLILNRSDDISQPLLSILLVVLRKEQKFSSAAYEMVQEFRSSFSIERITKEEP